MGYGYERDRQVIQVASELAVEAHEGQADLVGNPYIDHPFRVAHRAFREALSSWQEVAVLAYVVGLLHDVVEDTDHTLDTVMARVGPQLNKIDADEVREALDALTKREGESYEDYLDRVQGSLLARMVKRADVEDNLMRLHLLPVDKQSRYAARYAAAVAKLGMDKL